MAIERFEIIQPPLEDLRKIVRVFRGESDRTKMPRIAVVANRLGLLATERKMPEADEDLRINVQVLGIQPGETEDHIIGETGNNPVAAVNIIVSAIIPGVPDFPATMSLPIPNPPEDMLPKSDT